MKLKIICNNGNIHYIECLSFEYKSNWLSYTDYEHKNHHIMNVAVVKSSVRVKTEVVQLGERQDVAQ